MTQLTPSCSTTEAFLTARLKRDKFALLAKVGHAKRAHSVLQAETELYCTTATELLAISMELLALLESEEESKGEMNLNAVIPVSRLYRCVQKISNFCVTDTASEQRMLRLLESDGAVMAMDTCNEGYASPSMDLMLKNVARAIVASKGSSPKTSSKCATPTAYVPAGISGDGYLIRSLS